ncbi:CLUMA_CG015831, isoform A [Clunio marinus]|uniref:CLUMA_CG015831, isoform A n=1 Tax=Clunio marinus TaxID=568069 RepID=A0A1J1IU50_9DIPT|nr:CLUMA_CG015831, isoform A [Clunio marinus]
MTDKSIKLSNTICIRCSSSAAYMCSRCSARYCSIQCQRADWQNHRLDCAQLPPLMSAFDTNKSKLSSLSIDCSKRIKKHQNFIEKEDEELKVSKLSYLPISDCYEKEDSIKDSQKTDKDKEITKFWFSSLSCDSNFELKDDSKFEQKKELVTTEVREKVNKEIKLPEKIRTIKPLQPQIRMITPELLHKNEKQSAKSVNQSAILRLPPTSVSIKATAMKDVKTKVVQPFMYKDLKMRPWVNTGEVRVTMLHVYPPHFMVLAEETRENFELFDFIDKDVEECCKDLEEIFPYKPIKNEVVLALYKEDWYRAFVLSGTNKSDEYLIQFIELGNRMVVKSNEIMAVPTDKLRFEVCVRHFIVDNMPISLSKHQIELVKTCSFSIKNIRKETDNKYHCDVIGF